MEGVAVKGWVTTLVSNLSKAVAKQLRPKAEFWMDYKLRGNEPFTPAILDALDKSAMILIIFSPGYMNSRFCMTEKDGFLEKVKTQFRDDSRIFVVEHDKLRDHQKRPSEFGDRPNYLFWTQAENDKTPDILGWPYLKKEGGKWRGVKVG